MAARPLDTGTEQLLASLEDGVAVLTLNRPETRNALGDTISPALRRMIARLRDEPDARCVVITGAGNAFCSGGDVKGMAGGENRPDAPKTLEGAISDQAERQRTLTGALYSLPQPTIAALPGPAVGAGFSIALACDLRIAADTAFVSTGFANVGLPGDYGATFFLTHLVGTSRARELFYTADRIDAARCEELGIVNRVVPAEKLMDEAMDLARQLASGPPIAFRLMKRNLDLALREDLAACLGHEADATVTAARSRDHREAVRAFVEKRKPHFSDR